MTPAFASRSAHSTRTEPSIRLFALTALMAMNACADSPSASARPAPAIQTIAGTPDAVPDAFTGIAAARELSDGRVLVHDALEHRVVLVDFSAARVTPIGRIGSGPSEYRLPRALVAYRGDSSILTESTRLTSVQLIAPDGSFVQVTPGPATLAPQRIDFLSTAADFSGHLYAQVARRITSPTGSRLDPDSAAIERISFATGRRDTVASVSIKRVLPGSSLQPTPNPTAHQPFRNDAPPFAVSELWTVLQNGTVVIASAVPYRLRVITKTGDRRLGPLIPYDTVRVEDAHRVQWRVEQRRPKVVTMFTERGVSGQMRALGFEEPEAWPRLLPPFVRQAIRAGADGTIWIERTGAPQLPTLVDVFDDTASRIAQLRLPPARRLVGVGAAFLYLVRTDDDDIQYLERWPRPVRAR